MPIFIPSNSSANVRHSTLLVSLLLSANIALAAPPPITITNVSDEDVSAPTNGILGFMKGINRSNTLLGDMWGLRRGLSKNGLTLSLLETSEVLGNVSGGTKKGFVYDGLTQANIQLNTQRAFGHYGGLVNLSALHLHGTNFSAENLSSLQTSSGIASNRGFRLWELWYDQKFLDEDRLDVKIGQQSVDQEFMVSSNALTFVNTMFGWPMLPSADMPGGGPAYPLSALGVRLAARPIDGVTVLAGVYNGSPARTNDGDAQLENPHGVSFPVGNGTLSMLEVQYSYPSLGGMVQADEVPPLGFTYRLGAWYNSQRFSDQRFDDNGLSLANPASSGNALQHHGNFSYYAVADQLIWRDSRELNRTVGVFVRAMATPQSDRNVINGSLNAGVVMRCPFAYRTADTLGFGIGYAHVSGRVADLDRDTITYSGNMTPVRSSEFFAELTYQYQVKPWLQLQPDLQYVVNPGGGVENPNTPGQRIKNEWVFGLRANITF